MRTRSDKTNEASRQTEDPVSQRKEGHLSPSQSAEHGFGNSSQQALQEMANNSPRVKQLQAIQRFANNPSSSAGSNVIQCQLAVAGLAGALLVAVNAYNANLLAFGANPTNPQLTTLWANLQAVRAQLGALAPLMAAFVPPAFAPSIDVEENWVRTRQAANVAPAAIVPGVDNIINGYL
jgi:hypothetical protein